MKSIKVKTNSHEQPINLTVKPVTKPQGEQKVLLVVFEDVQPPRKAGSRKTVDGAQPEQSAAIAQYEEELRLTQ